MAEWKAFEPQVCQGDQRPWVRECDSRCHGSCAGNATELRNCTWSPLDAWVGPLYPTSAVPLTASIMETISSFIREAVIAELDKGEAVLGDVAPLRDLAPESNAAGQTRREGPAAFVDAGMVVTSGQEPGSVWLRMEIEVLPEVALELVALLPVHTGNMTGQAHILAPQGIALSMAYTLTPPSKASDDRSAAGVIVGAVMACLVGIVIVVLLVRRRRVQVQRVKTEPVKPEEQPRVVHNPLYEEGDDQFYHDVSSVHNYNVLESESGYTAFGEQDGRSNPVIHVPGQYYDESHHPAKSVHDSGYEAFGDVTQDVRSNHTIQPGRGLAQSVHGYNHLERESGYQAFGGITQDGRASPVNHTLPGHYFDVVPRAQSVPAAPVYDEVEQEGLYQDLGEDSHEYLAIGSGDGGRARPGRQSCGGDEGDER